MNQTELLTILNTASQDELTSLPGIGSALAERILAGRLFDTLEAAQTVKGISANLLERLMDIPASPLDPMPASEPLAADDAPAESRLDEIKNTLSKKGQAARETISGLGESVRKQKQDARQAVEALPEQFEQSSTPHSSPWRTLISSAVTVLIATLLTLVVLGGINGSLKFVTGSQYRTLQSDFSQLTTQADALQQDLDGLRTRMDTLEGFGERTVALEKAQEQLAADLKAADQQVTAMQTEVKSLNEKVVQQEERTQRFETFLQELQTLLGNLFTTQGEIK